MTNPTTPEDWAIKQHIEKNPKCEWICTHTNLPNLGEVHDTPEDKIDITPTQDDPDIDVPESTGGD